MTSQILSAGLPLLLLLARTRTSSDTRADNSVAGSYTYNADGQRTAYMFVVEGYSKQIFVNTKSGGYDLLKQTSEKR